MSSSTSSSFKGDETGKIVQLSANYVYKWEISEFSSYYSMNMGEEIRSEEFASSDLLSDITWQMALFPMGELEENGDYLSLFLHSQGYGIRESLFQFIIVDEKDNIVHESGMIVHKAGFNRCGCDRFISRQLLSEKIDKVGSVDNTLRIVCAIYVSSKGAELKLSNFRYTRSNNSYELEVSEKLEKILDDEKYSDVKFLIGEKSLQAHKNILSSRSPVFATMFDNDMKEKIESKVNIEDIDYDVFKEMLRFIYSGKVNNIEEIDRDLLAAADKYDIASLKVMCEESMCTTLSVDNVIELFSLADLYKLDKLKMKAKCFMGNNAKEIVKDPNFVTLKKIDGDLMIEIVRSLVL